MEAGRCNESSIPYGNFIVTTSLEGWETNAKEVPSHHEVKLAPLDTNPLLQCLGDTSTTLVNSNLLINNTFKS